MTEWLFTTLNTQRIDEVLTIEAASFRRPWNRRAFENEFTRRDATHFAVLSPDSRRMIGYVFFRILSGDMHLLKIAIAPGWRRMGVATWALKHCLAVARRRRIERMMLEVRVGNRAAISLYGKLGFKIVEIRHQYYNDTGEDALVMTKKVDA